MPKEEFAIILDSTFSPDPEVQTGNGDTGGSWLTSDLMNNCKGTFQRHQATPWYRRSQVPADDESHRPEVGAGEKRTSPLAARVDDAVLTSTGAVAISSCAFSALQPESCSPWIASAACGQANESLPHTMDDSVWVTGGFDSFPHPGGSSLDACIAATEALAALVHEQTETTSDLPTYDTGVDTFVPSTQYIPGESTEAGATCNALFPSDQGYLVELQKRHAYIDANTPGRPFCMQLVEACCDGNLVAVHEVLARGAVSNSAAVFVSAEAGHYSILDSLLTNAIAQGEDIRQYAAALRISAARGHTSSVQLLLQRGVDPNVEADDGCLAMIAASAYGHVDTVRQLLAWGADTAGTCREHGSPLLAAVRAGHLSVVAQLLAWQSSPHVDLEKALTMSIRDQNASMVDTLLQFAGPVQKIDIMLRVALESGHYGILRSLQRHRGAASKVTRCDEVDYAARTTITAAWPASDRVRTPELGRSNHSTLKAFNCVQATPSNCSNSTSAVYA